MTRKTEPIKTDVRFEGQFLRVLACGHWEFVERSNASGVVVILAITDEGHILLVEQFRPPVNSAVIEIPAGLAGDIAGEEDEAFRAAAARELEEETGYTAGTLRLLGSGPSSAGLTNEFLLFFEATNLKRTGPGGGDESESITVHEIPLTNLRLWLDSRIRSGVMVDPKIYATLAMAGRLIE
ncbi:MAG: NUDIX hydrolase [Planctomycetaceae bacterium]